MVIYLEKTYRAQQGTLRDKNYLKNMICGFTTIQEKGGENIGENYNELMYLRYSSKFQVVSLFMEITVLFRSIHYRILKK